MHIHLIGIGGTGLSPIAQVLIQRGYLVSGSDRTETALTQNLRRLGMRVFIGHHPQNVAGADLVLRSSAVSDENVEVLEALRQGIPVLKRVDFLERLTEGQECIAVAGSHGKSTTTAMLAWVFHSLQLDPSYIIGASSINLGANAHAGQGRFFVIEADEYDYMFLGLKPLISIVTNVEHDHPDCFPTFEAVLQAFKSFVSRTIPNGVLIACGEDDGALQLLDFARQQGLHCQTYGIGAGAFDYCADGLTYSTEGRTLFEIRRGDGQRLVQVSLQVPGLHNVRNALAVMAAVDQLSLPLAPAAEALQTYTGASRRFELVGEVTGITVISDYAHHPSEIQATLAAARSRYGRRRIWAVWQPHTFSRMMALQEQFSRAFVAADEILVTEVYPARELPPPGGFSAQSIADKIQGKASFVMDLERARAYLKQHARPGDVVIILSAGDADRLGGWLLSDLSKKIESDD